MPSPTPSPMPPIAAESLIQHLSWRYAVKAFDPTRKIPAEQWKTLEQAMVLAPSSYGLQPWRFFVIDNPAIREKLRAAAWNQSQITDASHLVVFARKTSMTAADVDAFVDRTIEVRGGTKESNAGYRDMMVGSITNPAGLPGGSLDAYTSRQVYIALGFLLASAALLEIDACPMEGFVPKQFDEILGLAAQGYTATVVATLGYRSPSDWLAPLPKVRARHEDVVRHV